MVIFIAFRYRELGETVNVEGWVSTPEIVAGNQAIHLPLSGREGENPLVRLERGEVIQKTHRSIPEISDE